MENNNSNNSSSGEKKGGSRNYQEGQRKPRFAAQANSRPHQSNWNSKPYGKQNNRFSSGAPGSKSRPFADRRKSGDGFNNGDSDATPARKYNAGQGKPYNSNKGGKPYGTRYSGEKTYGDKKQSRPYGGKGGKSYNAGQSDKPYYSNRSDKPYGDRQNNSNRNDKPYGENKSNYSNSNRNGNSYGERKQSSTYGERKQSSNYGDKGGKSYGGNSSRNYSSGRSSKPYDKTVTEENQNVIENQDVAVEVATAEPKAKNFNKSKLIDNTNDFKSRAERAAQDKAKKTAEATAEQDKAETTVVAPIEQTVTVTTAETETAEKPENKTQNKQSDKKVKEKAPAKEKQTAQKKEKSTEKSGEKETVTETKNAKPARNKSKENAKAPKLKVIFLGGVGEIGKNMTAIEYNGEIVVIDCGVSFPTDEMPGVDLVIPDTTYLEKNKSKVKAILLTHGHEDHIGSVPFVAPKLADKSHPLKLYGSKLTLGLVSNKLAEHNCLDCVEQIAVDDEDTVSIGQFSVEFIRVTHSVAGSLAICVTSPVGKVFVTGDFKIDHTPKHSLPMNLPRIADIGREGVLLLLCDSTNIERDGYTLSESTVADTFAEYFEKEKERRILVATFSSNVDRLQELFDLAKKYRRKIAVSGRSMGNVIETASKAGYLSFDPKILVPINQIDKMSPHTLLILCTGSQGEPMSALTRMARGENNQVHIGKNDTVIISATPIPGNEKGVYTCINALYKLGARVVYSSIEDIHVSGHAQKEELKFIHALVQPKFFIPVHGEYRHLKQHAEMAEQLGMNPKNIAIADLGDVAELSADSMSVKNKVTAGRVLIDGIGVGDVGDQLLKDRLALSQDGFVVIVCGVENGTVSVRPQVFARGSFYTGDGSNDNTVEDIKKIALATLTASDLKNINLNGLKREIQKQVRKYIDKKFDRSPMVIAVIMSSSLDE